MKKRVMGLLGTAVGFAGGVVVGSRIQGQKTNEAKVYKFYGYYNLLNQWLCLKYQGKSLEEYFVSNNYQTIAIYGMGELGNRLYDELKDTSVNIKYAIDKEVTAFSPIELRTLDEMTNDVDVVVVTAFFAMDEIQMNVEKKVTCPVISLEDVVYETL